MKKIISTIVLSLVCQNSFATSTIEFTPSSIPKNVHVFSRDGDAYVDLVPHGCSNYRYKLSPNHVKYDAIFSLLMAAQMGNREVVLRFDGCTVTGLSMGNIVGAYLK